MKLPGVISMTCEGPLEITPDNFSPKKHLKKIIRILGITALFVLLTALTQIGGLVLLLSFWIGNKWNRKIKYKTLLVFISVYFLAALLIVPLTAPMLGREKIIHTAHIKPTMLLTDLLNRNYVRPKINQVLQETEKELNGTGIAIKYLDANFPFFDGFPLLPHLSHNDGKKLDIGLVYKTPAGKLTNRKKSVSGYGVFVPAEKGEIDQTARCKRAGYFQYDVTKYVTLGKKNQELKYANQYTRMLIKAILKNNSVHKIFIEPHLRGRLNIADQRIRFHGCHAVRHDDHIHIEIK